MLFFVVGALSIFGSTIAFDHVSLDDSMNALVPGYVLLVLGTAFTMIGLVRIGRFAIRTFAVIARPQVIRLDIAVPGGPVRTVVRGRRRF